MTTSTHTDGAQCSLCGHVAKNLTGLSVHYRRHRCSECGGYGEHLVTCTMADTAATSAAVPQKETRTMATKTCPGVKGRVAAHEAPADEATFGRNAARKDGLGRSCKACWAIYTKVLKDSKGATDSAPVATDDAPAAISPLRSVPVEITDANDDVARLGGQPGWSTEVVGTQRYAVPVEPAAIATDDGQAALSTWKKARDAQRKREERAAAKAAKEAAAPTA